MGAPRGGDGGEAVISPCELAINSGRRVRIIPQVGGQQTPLPKIMAVPESPQRRFQRIHHIARAANVGGLFVLEGAAPNCVYRGRQRLMPPLIRPTEE